MAKKSKLPPNAVGLTQAIDRFTKQGDRGTALVAAAWLDDAVKECLRAMFRPDQRVVDELLQGDGPLGSFSSRIKLAYLLDLIDPAARADLDRIRGIRNDFAHRRDDLRFSTPSIRDRCRQLRGAAACKAGGWDLRSPKQRFVATAYFLTQYLLDATKDCKRNRPLDHDFYSAWIRRTAKHMQLEFWVSELHRLGVPRRRRTRS